VRKFFHYPAGISNRIKELGIKGLLKGGYL